MQVEELIIEVRNPSNSRIGQFRPGDLVGAKFILKFNNVGTWEMRLPQGHRLGEFLRLPGYGIIVTGPDNSVIFSGPTLSAKLEQTATNIDGDWTIVGSSDDIILNERLAYPTPSTADVTAQTSAYDVRSGAAETVLKSYVNANIGPSAPATRQISNLIIEADAELGGTVSGNARFQTLQEILYGLAQTGGVGYSVEQSGADIEFQVYVPQDRTATIRMDMDNNKLSRADYAYAIAKVTRAIMAGQGEAEFRQFVEVTTTESESAETDWARRIEVFKDGRNSSDSAQLTQSGQELLVDEGKTIVEMAVVPSDDINMRFAQDWYLGDKVTVVINDLEASAVVTEVGISIGADGVRIGATVGTPVGIDYDAKVLAKTQQIDQRVSNLERVTGYGVNTPYEPDSGTDGTQPTASGDFISGSFNRFGNMVHFSIEIDFTNITNFGTGQYFVTLPFSARVAYQFRDGCLHDISAGIDYHISGHVFEGEDVLQLFTTDRQGNRIYDFPFEQGEPITLTTADNFHIAGIYEIEG
jgi:hypothetical protein